jgi:protein phosphatase
VLRVADAIKHTDTGRQRRMNEDNAFARAPLFAVADGMGGAQAGEVAAQVAVDVLERGLPDGPGSAEDRLAGLVREANVRIHELSRTHPEMAGMGTTMTAAYLGDDDELAIAHVGDSRLYVARDGKLTRLTRDHSLVEELVQEGKLTPQEADEHPQRSIITRALGNEGEVLVDHMTYRAQAGDVYLICSDGLTSMIPEARVAELVTGNADVHDAARALVDAANAAGGRDNITVVLFRLEEVRRGDGPGAGAAMGADTLPGAPAPGHGHPDARAAVAVAEPATVEHRVPRGPAPAQGSATAPTGERPPRGRLWRFGRALLVVLVLGVPIFLGAFIASQSVYFLGTSPDGYLTLYRGLPYEGPLGVQLYSRNYESSVPVSTLPSATQRTVQEHDLRSREDAADIVQQAERGELAGQEPAS